MSTIANATTAASLSGSAVRRPVGSAAPDRADAPRRRLQVVDAPARRRRPKLFYGIVAVMGAFLIAAAQMSLSIMTTQGTYELAALTKEQRDLTYEKQILYDDVAGLSSPQYLAANAAALGMVINEAPSYLRLSDGSILGPSEVAMGSSSVDAIGRGAVANALITDTPLVTVPDATIDGVPVDVGETPDGGVGNTPPPLTDGLPTPSTH
ncbi:hypothetical protein B1729_07940 [Microbacterium sp. B35-04]|uniref:hypothetical protein n=1 Tax=Microbacterium sp. B35-04 TaxID=1961716 RepID=UPI001EF8CA25|nr:hypothetical protein [Microbacterium sp. B35-04]KAF2413672.1 hypothetical protein B1729_07940 [Microbacterium sp. B35-04]